MLTSCYIYIYRERERERERDIYIYIFIGRLYSGLQPAVEGLGEVFCWTFKEIRALH